MYLANAKIFNKDMVQEAKDVLNNAKKVNKKEMPQVSLYFLQLTKARHRWLEKNAIIRKKNGN